LLNREGVNEHNVDQYLYESLEQEVVNNEIEREENDLNLLYDDEYANEYEEED
jgi:hypothetical protein